MVTFIIAFNLHHLEAAQLGINYPWPAGTGSVQCPRYRRLMDITVHHVITDVDDAIEIAQQIDA